MRKVVVGVTSPSCNKCNKQAVIYDKHHIFWCAKCMLKKQKMSDAKGIKNTRHMKVREIFV